MFIFNHEVIEYARNFSVTIANLVTNEEIKKYLLNVTHINADAALKFNSLIEKTALFNK